MNVNNTPHSFENHALVLPAATLATSASAEAGGTVSTVVIGLFTLTTTLVALYLIARGRSRDDHRGDE